MYINHGGGRVHTTSTPPPSGSFCFMTKSQETGTRPAKKTYAQVVTSPSRRTALVHGALSELVKEDNDDDWTDVSSISSCSWPSVPGEAESARAAGSSNPEGAIASNGPTSTSSELSYPQDACLVTRRLSEGIHDSLLVANGGMDTRGEHASESAFYHANRSNRLYNQVHACFHTDKPWRPFPGRSHKTLKTVDEEKVTITYQAAVIIVAENALLSGWLRGRKGGEI